MKNKEKINKILQIIANTLYINQHRINAMGLLNGKMGIVIFLYHYARYNGHNVYEELADDFIDNVINNKINDVRHPNFSEGISGLAWGFNYLIENKFIEIEDNTVLDDLEAFLLKTISAKTTQRTEIIDLFGIGLYYISKLKRNLWGEKDTLKVNVLVKKWRIIIREYESNAIFDIFFLNFLLYFLTKIAENLRIKEKTLSGLLSAINDMLLKQMDYSIYSDEDIYILQKNIEQVQILTSKKDKWNQIKITS